MRLNTILPNLLNRSDSANCMSAMWVLFLIFSCIVPVDGTAQLKYSGLWQEGGDREKLWVDATISSFEKKREEFALEGYSLVDVEISGDSSPRFSAVWHPEQSETILEYDLTWEAFQNQWLQLGERDMALTDFEIYESGGVLKVLGLWHPGRANLEMLHNMDWPSFRSRARQLATEGYRLKDVEAYQQAGNRRFAGLWEQADGLEMILGNLDGPSLEEISREMADNYMNIIDLESFSEAGGTRFIGVWREGEQNQMLLTDVSWNVFLTRWKDDRPVGMRLIDLEVSAPGQRLLAQQASPPTTTTPSGGSSTRQRRRVPVEPVVEPPVTATPSGTTTPSDEQDVSARPRTGPQEPVTTETVQGEVEEGFASYYGEKFQGRPTASGEPYDGAKYTAAHRTHKFGTLLKVTSVENGLQVNVRVNDRGPFVPNRIIDLSKVAAEQIKLGSKGVAKVTVSVVRQP